MVNGSISRERTFTAAKTKKRGILKRILFLVFIIAAIFVIRFTGATSYLEQGALRFWDSALSF